MRTDRIAIGREGGDGAEVVCVSVVIPHLNQPAALLRCLESLDGQTLARQHFEVIVVDNGSATPPAEIVARFPAVRLGFEPRPGPGPARNRGVELTRGEILAFIDADCIADREWLATICRNFGEGSDGVILGGDVRIACSNPARLTALEAYESVFAYRQKEYIERYGFSGTGNLSVLRRDFGRIGPFPGIDEAEDVAWGRRAGALGYRIRYVRDMVVFHPARASFAELTEKWNRHIRHEYVRRMRDRHGRLAWLLRSLAVAASALADSRKVLVSRRIAGAHARGGAMVTLARIRLFRAWRMACFLWKPPSPDQSLSWNRPVRTHDLS